MHCERKMAKENTDAQYSKLRTGQMDSIAEGLSRKVAFRV